MLFLLAYLHKVFEDLKEMTNRLKIPYDIISDANLQFANLIKLPTFKVDEKVFIKRLTLIIQSSIINKSFLIPFFLLIYMSKM